jgi:hypothetical protein
LDNDRLELKVPRISEDSSRAHTAAGGSASTRPLQLPSSGLLGHFFNAGGAPLLQIGLGLLSAKQGTQGNQLHGQQDLSETEIEMQVCDALMGLLEENIKLRMRVNDYAEGITVNTLVRLEQFEKQFYQENSNSTSEEED